MIEPWHCWRDAGSASAFFRSVAKAIGEVPRLEQVVEHGADAADLPSSGVHAPGISDPTANRAIWLADHDDAERDAARARLAEVRMMTDAAKTVIGTVRRGLGETYADALRSRFIERLSWRESSEALGAPVRTLRWRVQVALDWCDSQPVTYLFGGVDLSSTRTVW